MWRWIISLALLAGLAWWLRPDPACAIFQTPGSEVWLTIGQSNAANHGEHRFAGARGVFAFDGRSCLPARDPLPGASGTGGSVWIPLAARWIAEGRASRVLIVSRAEQSTTIAQWQPGGALFGRVVAAAAGLERSGLRVSRVLWSHGESDAHFGTSGARYAAGLDRLAAALRRQGVSVPMNVAVSSVCGPSRSPAIRAEQLAAGGRVGLITGPDLDLIPPTERYERCHFRETGQISAARLWAAALVKPLPH